MGLIGSKELAIVFCRHHNEEALCLGIVTTPLCLLDPLTSGPDYISFLYFLLVHRISAFKQVENKTSHQSARFENS